MMNFLDIFLKEKSLKKKYKKILFLEMTMEPGEIEYLYFLAYFISGFSVGEFVLSTFFL